MAVLQDIQKQRQEFFKQKREQALGTQRAQEQEQEDALKRRFTSLGAYGSGAQLKAEERAGELGAAQRRALENELRGQEMQAAQGDFGLQFQEEQARLGREFGSSEAEKARQAAFKESALGREFAGGESALGRKFQEEQARLGREFGSGEAERQRLFQGGLAGQDLEFKKQLAEIERGFKEREFGLAREQFDLDKSTTEFNKRMAEMAANNEGQGGLTNLGSSLLGLPRGNLIDRSLGAATTPLSLLTGGGSFVPELLTGGRTIGTIQSGVNTGSSAATSQTGLITGGANVVPEIIRSISSVSSIFG